MKGNYLIASLLSSSMRNFSTTVCKWEKISCATKINRSKKTVQKLSSQVHGESASKLRNVGIIAHIDAGKTTTTERFLYYSGVTDTIGSVDEGTTVTDYLAQERERGITIQSAAISLHWRQNRVNIIDTPGHIDFTVEVERALRVMDSAIGVLDASAGVEAQTKTVWKQANKFKLPRILFLNKMDKQKADVEHSLESIKKELGVKPLLTQWNLGVGRDFEGVIDLLTMTKLIWDRKVFSKEFVTSPLVRTDDSTLFEKALSLRQSLVDSLAEIDSDMMDTLVASNNYEEISADTIKRCINRVTCANLAVPVLLGSSLKNCCIQPLLDAVIDYLPSPEYNNSMFALDNQLCAFAFKTIHQKDRGAVTFLRLYNGTFSGSSSVYNATSELTDKIGKMYTILADQMIETKLALPGNILAVTGLSKTITGDILLKNASAVQKYSEADVQLPSLTISDPVFMCSVETYSSKDQRALEEALRILVKEDPSLRVKIDPETQQMVLMGMGELHMDVVKDRLLREHKLEVYLGKMLVAYRERINTPSTIIHHTLNRTIGDINHHASVSLSVEPSEKQSRSACFVRSGQQSWNNLKWFHRQPINRGTSIALMSGPLLGYPVVDCCVNVHDFTVHSYRTSAAIISACVTEAIHQALQESGIILSEPVMSLQIYCEDEHLADILADLAQRRAVIGGVVHKDDGVIVQAQSPVATLLGYSTTLRKISSGRAHFMMEIEGYISMTEQQTQNVVSDLKTF